MPDKTANWGVPGSGARYRTQDSDPSGGGNFRVAQRLDSNGDPVDVLLEWDEVEEEWVYGGPVNLDGSDVTNVGALDADSVSTADATTVSLNVPSDYSTLPEAVTEANKIYKRRGFEVVVNIESGYAPSNRLDFTRGNYSYITIQSEDSTVTVDSAWPDDQPFLVGINAWMPKLDCLVDMDGQNPNTDASYIAARNCIAEVGDGGGIINSGNHGFVGRNGTYWLERTNWYGAGADGIEAQQLSTVQAAGADVSDCGRYGIFTSREATFHGGGDPGDASNCGDGGLRAARSFANVQGWDLSGGPRAITAERSSVVNGQDINAKNTTDRAINNFNSLVNASGADISGSTGTYGVFVAQGGVVNATDATAENVDLADVVLAETFGKAVVEGATITLVSGTGVSVTQGGLAEVHNVTIDGSSIAESDTNQSLFNNVTTDGIIIGDATKTDNVGVEGYYYAGDYDGADADTRLDNALSDADENNTIYLEQATYDADRTISKPVSLIGTQTVSGNTATTINGVWSLTARCKLKGFYLGSGQITVDSERVRISHWTDFGSGIVVNGDNCNLTHGYSGSVTFASGTSGGLIDSSNSVTVTDNGSNTIGDIS